MRSLSPFFLSSSPGNRLRLQGRHQGELGINSDMGALTRSDAPDMGGFMPRKPLEGTAPANEVRESNGRECWCLPGSCNSPRLQRRTQAKRKNRKAAQSPVVSPNAARRAPTAAQLLKLANPAKPEARRRQGSLARKGRDGYAGSMHSTRARPVGDAKAPHSKRTASSATVRQRSLQDCLDDVRCKLD